MELENEHVGKEKIRIDRVVKPSQYHVPFLCQYYFGSKAQEVQR